MGFYTVDSSLRVWNGLSWIRAGGNSSSTTSLTIGSGLNKVGDTVKLGYNISTSEGIGINDSAAIGYFSPDYTSFSQLLIYPHSFLNFIHKESSTGQTMSLKLGQGASLISRSVSGGQGQSIGMETDGYMYVRDSIASKGLVYGANYGANFTARSLIDKGFLDSIANKKVNIQDSLTKYVTPKQLKDSMNTLSGGGLTTTVLDTLYAKLGGNTLSKAVVLGTKDNYNFELKSRDTAALAILPDGTINIAKRSTLKGINFFTTDSLSSNYKVQTALIGDASTNTFSIVGTKGALTSTYPNFQFNDGVNTMFIRGNSFNPISGNFSQFELSANAAYTTNAASSNYLSIHPIVSLASSNRARGFTSAGQISIPSTATGGYTAIYASPNLLFSGTSSTCYLIDLGLNSSITGAYNTHRSKFTIDTSGNIFCKALATGSSVKKMVVGDSLGNLSLQAITFTSGSYLPICAGSDSYSPNTFYYTRNGNVVHVAGSIVITHAAPPSYTPYQFTFDMMLPIASNLTATDNLSGVVSGKNVTASDSDGEGNWVEANATEDRATVHFIGNQDGSNQVHVQFDYIVQ